MSDDIHRNIARLANGDNSSREDAAHRIGMHRRGSEVAASRAVATSLTYTLHNDPDGGTRAQSAEALGNFFLESRSEPADELTLEVIGSLVIALRDGHWHVRYLAVEALSKVKYSVNAPELIEKFTILKLIQQTSAEDLDERVRMVALYHAKQLMRVER